ncbi:MAG TPA: hypothetical protein DD733_07625 [Clostridiales bacterium]|nr:hypothetical protein [Clostridiales bacterium]
MQPTKFKEQNITFTKPASMTDEQCSSLPAYRDDREIISCWKMTWKERIKVLFIGKIWFSVYGTSQPPICLSVDTFFAKAGSKNG